MNMRRWLSAGLACVLLLLAGGGCGGSGRLDAPNAGQTKVFLPGVPNFDLVAVASLQDGQPGIDCYLGLPHASLVFLPAGSAFEARFDVLYRLLDAGGRHRIAEYTDVDTVRLTTYEATQRFEPFLLERRLAVAPGVFVLEVTVSDAQSAAQALRRQRVEVMAPGTAQPVISPLRMEGRRAGKPFEPILSVHLPAGMDSLRAAVALYNAGHLDDLVATMRLLRFPSDTTAARPPYLYTVSPFFGLVRYDRPDTLQVSRRLLRDVDEAVELAFDLPVLEEGIYRIEVSAARSEPPDAVAVLEQRRDFAVRSATFPNLSLLDELIEAVVYIATEEELGQLRSSATQEEKKRRFDAFWGGLVTNRQQAGTLLKRYYSRVEEANQRYTSYKDGWKTDRGMVFILFGAPLYVDWSPEGETWHYSYDEREALRSFHFERRPLYDSGGLFEAYALERGMPLEREWRRARDRWRRGEAR